MGANSLNTATTATVLQPAATVTKGLEEPRDEEPARVGETKEGRRGKEEEEQQDVFLSLLVQLPAEWVARFNRPVLSLRSLPAQVVFLRHEKGLCVCLYCPLRCSCKLYYGIKILQQQQKYLTVLRQVDLHAGNDKAW